MNVIMRGRALHQAANTTTAPPLDVPHYTFSFAPGPVASNMRSYASNGNDALAGQAPSNLHDIDDSDDDDVEVVQVTRSA
jgi:hypothetical protein